MGKSPERRVVMPAGAFKFLKNDIRQKIMKKVGVIDERSLKKSTKTSRESVRWGREHSKKHRIPPIWNSSADPSDRI